MVSAMTYQTEDRGLAALRLSKFMSEITFDIMRFTMKENIERNSA